MNGPRKGLILLATSATSRPRSISPRIPTVTPRSKSKLTSPSSLSLPYASTILKSTPTRWTVSVQDYTPESHSSTPPWTVWSICSEGCTIITLPTLPSLSSLPPSSLSMPLSSTRKASDYSFIELHCPTSSISDCVTL